MVIISAIIGIEDEMRAKVKNSFKNLNKRRQQFIPADSRGGNVETGLNWQNVIT